MGFKRIFDFAAPAFAFQENTDAIGGQVPLGMAKQLSLIHI